MPARIASIPGLLGAAVVSLCAALGGCGSLLCEPAAVYGPKPCGSDQECVDEYGEGWYCDKDHAYGDGCGGENKWPICMKKK
jgi:hypothetical protein